jgi:predicted DCC family thiol-disulfide oxidoreductase YuxK
MSETYVILYDGYCTLCTGLIRFVLKEDKEKVFQFASQGSVTGQNLLDGCEGGLDLTESIVLIMDEGCSVKSDAVLNILRSLPGLWALGGVFRLVPRSVRDWIYEGIAHNRNHWFGRRDVCMVSISGHEDRFIT